jgi:hypothetical protein
MWRVQQIKLQGSISSTLPAKDRVYPELIDAYQWMATQLALRTRAQAVSAPCWAWHRWGGSGGATKPDLLDPACMSAGEACLELEVPEELVLLSQFDMWCDVLVGAPVLLSQSEIGQFESLYGDGELPDTVVRATWDRIFDLEGGEVEFYGPLGHRTIQACLPSIDLSFVRAIEEKPPPE